MPLASLPDGSLLAVSGMGFESAERSVRALIDAGCGALVSWGLAGGLDPQVSSGTIVLPEAMLLEGAPPLRAHAAWRERVFGVLAAFRGKVRSDIRLPVETGIKILTSRRPLASSAEKRRAFLDSGALAVDMESYAIAAVAAERGLPFIAIRVIVDAATDEVPAALLDASDDRGRFAIPSLLARVLASPGSLVPMLGLARRYGVARRALLTVARAGAPGRP